MTGLKIVILSLILLPAFTETREFGTSGQVIESNDAQIIEETSIIILGTVQDAGSPHIACQRDCCKHLFSSPDSNRKVVSLGVVDP